MNWEVGIGPGAYYHSEWGAAVPRRELSSALCDARGRVEEGPRGSGCVCVHVTDSHCAAEANTTL